MQPLRNKLFTHEYLGNISIVKFMCVVLLILSTFPLSGQSTKNIEKVVIGDYCYILHTVQRNETLYSISRLYECTQEEVLSSNKIISGIIKKGMILKIPDHSYQKPQIAKIDESKFVQHLVSSGDNYYQLNLKYGVDEQELLKYNPVLKEGLKAGMTLMVPKKPREEIAKQDIPPKNTPSKELQAPVKTQGKDKTWNVGLYLPLTATVADSMKTSARSTSYLAFYQGVLMAVDQLSKAGIQVKLFVYDTEKQVSSIESLVRKPEFLSFDLLIGPVFPEMQKTISELSAKNRIPMVSPLSPEDKFAKTNPCYFQVNPVRKLRMEATADYIAKEFPKEKIIFLESETGSTETRQIHEYLDRKGSSRGIPKSLHPSYNLWTKGIEGLEAMLQPDKQNIFVMAEMNEVNVSIAMNRLALLSKKYPLLLVGVQEFTRMHSIETENLHNLNMRILTTSFVDFNRPKVIAFTENFKTEFGTEPSLFAFQGYDVTTFFLQSLQKSENLSRGIVGDSNAGLLNAAYHFSKISEFGGYTNDRFIVIEYSNSYDVKSLGVIQHAE
ncbi:MAG: ABC transporter substrate-binding protein [Prolixibacteraceae bacterium]